MWFNIWTRRDALEDRPLCLLVHYLVLLNILCLAAVQGFVMALFGRYQAVSATWAFVSFGLLAVHAGFLVLFTWIDGDLIAFGAGGTSGASDGAAGEGGGGSDGGGSGDGGSAG